MFNIEVKFNSERIKKLYLDLNDVLKSKNLLEKEIGSELTKHFKIRCNQIKSCSNYAEFVHAHIDKTESLVGDMKGYYSMTLSKNYRIVVSPNTNDLSIEYLKNVNAFTIIGVIDYHGTGKKNNKWLIK